MRRLSLALIGTVALSFAGSCEEGPPQLGPQGGETSWRKLQFFKGLEETVTLVKTANASYALRANGERTSIEDVRRLDRAAWAARFGVMTSGLANIVTQHNGAAIEAVDAPGTSIPFFVMVGVGTADSEADAQLDLDLRSTDPVVAAAAREVYSEKVAIELDAIESQLLALGITVDGRGHLMPILWGKGAPDALLEIASLPQVLVMGNAAPSAPADQIDVEAPASFHATDTAFHGFSGEDEKVGVIDTGTCKIRDTNNLIARTIQYQDTGPSPSCSVDVDCDPLCGSEDSVCSSGHCLDSHGTAVTSVITQILRDATIYYPNESDEDNRFGHDDVTCTPAIIDAYEFLVGNDVKFVNESYECIDPDLELDGVVEDFFERRFGIFITKSASNNTSDQACPTTWNGVCVGGVNRNIEMYCRSSYDNDLGDSSDREEPDVTAYAGDGSSTGACPGVPEEFVLVAGAGSDIHFLGERGNSFAAPAVTALAVLTKEWCEDQGDPIPDDLLLRAMVMNGAWKQNPDGWRYSTPRPFPTDHKDGGGFIDGWGLLPYCGDQPEDGFAIYGTGEIDPEKDGVLGMPDKDPEYPDAPPETYAPELSPADQDLKPSMDGATYRVENLFAGAPGAAIPFREGDRLRFSFAFRACAYDGTVRDDVVVDPADRGVAVDFDIFLYNATKDDMLFASQSFDDVNEGFDVTIPEDWDGDYQVLLVWPEESTGCKDEPEQFAWTAMGWFLQ